MTFAACSGANVTRKAREFTPPQGRPRPQLGASATPRSAQPPARVRKPQNPPSKPQARPKLRSHSLDLRGVPRRECDPKSEGVTPFPKSSPRDRGAVARTNAPTGLGRRPIDRQPVSHAFFSRILSSPMPPTPPPGAAARGVPSRFPKSRPRAIGALWLAPHAPTGLGRRPIDRQAAAAHFSLRELRVPHAPTPRPGHTLGGADRIF